MAIPDHPGPLLPYANDHTVVLSPYTGANDSYPRTLSKRDLMELIDPRYGLHFANSEWAFDPGYAVKNYISFVFPRPTTVLGWFSSTWSYFTYSALGASITVGGRLKADLYASTDTTNGVDGAWVLVDEWGEGDSQLGASIGSFDGNFLDPDLSVFRNSRDLSGLEDIRALRIVYPQRPSNIDGPPTERPGAAFTAALVCARFYGYPGRDDRLVFENLDASPADPRLGDIDHESQEIFEIQVRNNTDVDAEGVFLTAEEAFLTYDVKRDITLPEDVDAPTYIPRSALQIRFSVNGSEWGPIVELGDIESGGVSPAVSVRVDPIFGTVGYRGANLRAKARRWV